MSSGLPQLRSLGLGVRLGLTGIVLTLAGGYAASVAHMVDHHGKKDEQAGLSMDDITGAYHGVERPARLMTVVAGDHGAEYLNESERAQLTAWLEGSNQSVDYDDLDAGDDAPAEILARNCLSCHSRRATNGGGIGETVPLDYWDDVGPLVFSQQLSPASTEILITTTHTHASSMALITLAAAGLFLLTRWPRFLRQSVFALGGVSLFLDLGGWWLAREAAWAVYLILAAGAVYGLAIALSLAGTFLDLWLPGRRDA